MTDKQVNERPVSIPRIELLCTLVAEIGDELALVREDLRLPDGSPSDIAQDLAKVEDLVFRRNEILNAIADEANRVTYAGIRWDSLNPEQVKFEMGRILREDKENGGY